MQASLTPEQVRLVLRRAAELAETQRRDSAGPPAEGGFGEHEVAEIAAEVGIDPDAVRRALSEVRAGMVVAAPAKPTFLDRVVGPAELVYTRRLPCTAAAARAALEALMRDQVMQLRPDLGDQG